MLQFKETEMWSGNELRIS